MKKLTFLFLLVSFLVLTVQAQRIQISFGSHSPKEIKEYQKNFSRQLEYYFKKISSLERAGYRLEDDSGKLVKNQAEILLYKEKVDILENALAELNMSIKPNQSYINGHTRDLRAATELYIMDKQLGDSPAIDLPNKKAYVANHWHQEVTAVIRGPGGYRNEVYLAPGAEETFQIKYLGQYTVTFVGTQGSKSKTCPTGINKFYSYKGKEYAFYAVLPAR